jgi:hypothetical protein
MSDMQGQHSIHVRKTAFQKITSTTMLDMHGRDGLQDVYG